MRRDLKALMAEPYICGWTAGDLVCQIIHPHRGFHLGRNGLLFDNEGRRRGSLSRKRKKEEQRWALPPQPGEETRIMDGIKYWYWREEWRRWDV